MSAASWGSARFTPRGSGDSAWVELMDCDFSLEADQTPSSNQLVFGGVTWTVEGAGNDTAGGPKVASGALVISPDLATNVARSSASKRSAPILHSTLSNLGAPFSALSGVRSILVAVEIASWSPSATQEAFRIGLETAAKPLGSGSTGRGVMGGSAFSTTQRAGSIVFQDSAGTGNTDSTASVAVASMACLFTGAGVAVYSSATPSTYTSPETVLAATAQISGGTRGSATMGSHDRLLLVGESPDVSAGPPISISRLRIWARE